MLKSGPTVKVNAIRNTTDNNTVVRVTRVSSTTYEVKRPDGLIETCRTWKGMTRMIRIPRILVGSVWQNRDRPSVDSKIPLLVPFPSLILTLSDL